MTVPASSPGPADETGDALVSIRDLDVHLPSGSDRERAVDGIDLDIAPGRILCLVGESGSGKSLTAHAIVGLVPKGLRTTGTVSPDATTDWVDAMQFRGRHSLEVELV